MSALHVIVRSCGSENRKQRPEWYSKDLALASLLVATKAARADGPVDLTFVNDGVLPPQRVAAMHRVGRVVPIAAGSNRPSLRATVRHAAGQPWADDDLVYLIEDDYLLAPDALVRLREGAADLPWADWFTLHGTTAFGDPVETSTMPAAHRVAAGLPTPLPSAGWAEVVSTTSSLAGRMRAVREDEDILRWAPFSGGAFDEVTTLVLAGHQPFSWGDVASGRALPGQSWETEPWQQALARRLARAWANLRAHRRPAKRRRLAGARPPAAVHLELDPVSADPRWAEVAATTPDLASAVEQLA